jgi:hypothetical protein
MPPIKQLKMNYIHLLIIIFSLNSTLSGTAKELALDNPKIFVSVILFDKKWKVSVMNASEKEISGSLIDGFPRNFGVEFWDQKTGTGRRVFAPGAKFEYDGALGEQFSIESGKSITFDFDPITAWSGNAVTLEIWRNYCKSGYLDCRIFFNSFSSPLYSVWMNDGQVEAAFITKSQLQ